MTPDGACAVPGEDIERRGGVRDAVGAAGWLALLFLGMSAVGLTLHELGHLAAGWLRGLPAGGLQLSLPFGGAALVHDRSGPTDYLTVALAGPAVDLAIVVSAAGARFWKNTWARGLHLLLAAVAAAGWTSSTLFWSLGSRNDLNALGMLPGYDVPRLAGLVVVPIFAVTALLLGWWAGILLVRGIGFQGGPRWQAAVVLTGLGFGVCCVVGLRGLGVAVEPDDIPAKAVVRAIGVAIVLGLAALSLQAPVARVRSGLVAAGLALVVILYPVSFWDPGLPSDLTVSPERFRTIVEGAEAADEQGDHAHAAELWAEAARISPQPYFWQRRAESLAKTGAFEQAMQAARKGVDASYAPHVLGAMLVTLAETAHAAGDDEEACRALQRQFRLHWRAGFEQARKRARSLLEQIPSCEVDER